MSLRALLNLGISAFFLFLLGCGLALVVFNARQAVHEEVDSSITLAQRLLAGGGDGRLMRPGIGFQLRTLEEIRHLCIDVHDTSGKAVWSSDDCTPEKSPVAPVWFAGLLAVSERRYERNLSNGGVLVIRSAAADEIDEVWRDTRSLMILIVLFAMVANIGMYALVGRAMRPVAALEAAMDRVAQGRYGHRLEASHQPEFARIATHFNQMVSVLEQRSRQVDYLSRKSVSIQEEERRTLARELHDELGQSLAAIRADAATIEHHADAIPEPVLTSARAIRDVASSVYEVVKNMMKRLRPGSLDELGLTSALREMTEDWRAHHDVDCTLRIQGTVPEHDEANIHVFRIVQEALTNVGKHAGANSVVVSLRCADDMLTLAIEDDGHGFETEGDAKGLGLLGISERAAMLHGESEIGSRPGQGTRVTVRLPLGPRSGNFPVVSPAELP